MSHGPDELSSAARTLLRDYGRTIAPRHDGAAVLRAVQARVGATTLAAAPATSHWRRLALVIGVAAIAVLGAWPDSSDRAPPGPVAATVGPVRAVQRIAPGRPIAAAPVGESSGAGDALGGSGERVDAPAPELVRRAVASPTSTRQRPPGKTKRPATDLAIEVAVLERARTALARGDIAVAEQAIAEHRLEFAHGRLVAERDATAVMIACAADRGGAREAARRHLTRADAAPYRARIEATCDR